MDLELAELFKPLISKGAEEDVLVHPTILQKLRSSRYIDLDFDQPLWKIRRRSSSFTHNKTHQAAQAALIRPGREGVAKPPGHWANNHGADDW